MAKTDKSRGPRDSSGLIAGIAGGGVFLTFLLGLDFGIPISLGAGLIGFAVSAIAFKKKAPTLTVDMGSGIDIEQFNAVLEHAKQIEQQFKAFAKEMPASIVKQNVFALGDLTRRIRENVEEDPKDHKAAGKFLDYYAEAAIKICRIFIDVSKRGVNSAEFRAVSQKVESNLAMLEKAFTVQLAKLQEDNLLDLDIELSVLERTLQMEGMMDDINKEEASRS